jgi:hypothetical protein
MGAAKVADTRKMVERAVEAMLIGHLAYAGIPVIRALGIMAEATLAEEKSLNIARVAARYEGVEDFSEFAMEELLIIQDINFRDAGTNEAAILTATRGAIQDILEGIIMEDVFSGISPN